MLTAARRENVLAALEPHSVAKGGPLKVERIHYTEGRGNVIVTYPGATSQSVAIVGAHMDVVPANPENWSRDPFKLTVEGDELHGRGATDCLGHVALLTELMVNLAIAKPALTRTVTAVFVSERARREQTSERQSERAGERRSSRGEARREKLR